MSSVVVSIGVPTGTTLPSLWRIPDGAWESPTGGTALFLENSSRIALSSLLLFPKSLKGFSGTNFLRFLVCDQPFARLFCFFFFAGFFLSGFFSEFFPTFFPLSSGSVFSSSFVPRPPDTTSTSSGSAFFRLTGRFAFSLDRSSVCCWWPWSHDSSCSCFSSSTGRRPIFSSDWLSLLSQST